MNNRWISTSILPTEPGDYCINPWTQYSAGGEEWWSFDGNQWLDYSPGCVREYNPASRMELFQHNHWQPFVQEYKRKHATDLAARLKRYKESKHALDSGQ